MAIEEVAYTKPELSGMYPLSLSARTQVLKGRLNSNEVVPYFGDLSDPSMEVHSMFFHTRFSTNTAPNATMAQPFRLMAHNGELNTDKKNRLSDNAIALAFSREIIRPYGQSDSCRLDQTLQNRVLEDDLDLVTAVVAMMPPAWENDPTLSPEVRAMLEFFSLYEEKNDGPAALIFGDGRYIGARLDRLGLRPLRTVETDEYLGIMSEAGQLYFAPERSTRRGRIEAGGMLYYDHSRRRSFDTTEALEMLAAQQDYPTMVTEARVNLDDLPAVPPEDQLSPARYNGDLNRYQRYVAYSLNQESFKFLMDPMLATGQEKISAMGYGAAINALSNHEGGIARYFSQRFAQVTNPPLDSIREADGMTLRVALGAKPNSGARPAPQIMIHVADPHPPRHAEDPRSEADAGAAVRQPVPHRAQRRRGQLRRVDQGHRRPLRRGRGLRPRIRRHRRRLRPPRLQRARRDADDHRHLGHQPAAHRTGPAPSGVGDRGERSGLLVAPRRDGARIRCVGGLLARRADARGGEVRTDEASITAAFKRFKKAAEKSLMKTMGRVGLCTVESYIGGEFFEPSYLDTNGPVLDKYFPNVISVVGGVGFRTLSDTSAEWHGRALEVGGEKDVPLLGLFKERAEGAGHSYGTTAVRGFIDMTEEAISFGDEARPKNADMATRCSCGRCRSTSSKVRSAWTTRPTATTASRR